MKKKYFFILTMCSAMAWSQQTISFETSEGYALGDLNAQNGWTVTESSDGFITNQIITNEKSKDGNYSFKNAHLDGTGPQWFPIIGAEKTFPQPLDYKNTTISYDFLAPGQGGADYEFAVYAINEQEETFDIMTAVGFQNEGKMYFYTKPNFDGYVRMDDVTWQPNQWYNMEVRFTADKLIYLLNGTQVLEAPNTSTFDLIGFNLLHNNYGGDAYYDNIKINSQPLAVHDLTSAKITVYPNPVEKTLHLTFPANEKAAEITVYNTAGQLLQKVAGADTVDVSAFAKGMYIIIAKTDKNRSYQTKFIKK